MNRITHPQQQGARIAWNNSLFEAVPLAKDEPVEVREVTWQDWDDAKAEADRREGVCA